jgi:limonene-1,2-epoxide hydrolase
MFWATYRSDLIVDLGASYTESDLMDINTDIPTEWQMVEADQQQKNAALVREFLEKHFNSTTGLDGYFASNARIWVDSNTSIMPVAFDSKTFYYGPEGVTEIRKKHLDLGFSYEVTIHDIYACGPVVLVTRTDNRREKGKSDYPIPMTGAFAVRNGHILEWVDYYR